MVIDGDRWIFVRFFGVKWILRYSSGASLSAGGGKDITNGAVSRTVGTQHDKM